MSVVERRAGVTRIQDTTGTRWLASKGLYMVFYKPGEFFENVKNTGGMSCVLLPYTIFGILIIISACLIVDTETASVISEITKQGIDPNSAPPEWFTKRGLLMGRMVNIITPFITTGIASFFLMARKLDHKWEQLLSVVMYGEFLYAVGLLLTSFLVLATGNIYSGFSLGPLAIKNGYEPTTSALFALASKIDVFLIWNIVIVAIGLEKILGLRKKRTISLFSLRLFSIKECYLISAPSVSLLPFLYILTKM
jgi:hypothetical protein